MKSAPAGVLNAFGQPPSTSEDAAAAAGLVCVVGGAAAGSATGGDSSTLHAVMTAIRRCPAPIMRRVSCLGGPGLPVSELPAADVLDVLETAAAAREQELDHRRLGRVLHEGHEAPKAIGLELPLQCVLALPLLGVTDFSLVGEIR